MKNASVVQAIRRLMHSLDYLAWRAYHCLNHKFGRTGSLTETTYRGRTLHFNAHPHSKIQSMKKNARTRLGQIFIRCETRTSKVAIVVDNQRSSCGEQRIEIDQ